MINLSFVDTNIEVCRAFEDYFGKYDNMKVFNCPFQELEEYDCLVSPANSYGSLSGGVDYHIREYFGRQLESRVQDYIAQYYFGEQPVGTSFIIDTGHPTHPFLAHTPTMRVPLKIQHTDNVYDAMRALLMTVFRFNSVNNDVIKTVACTGMGTLIGGMEPRIAVGQMELAYRSFVDRVPKGSLMDGFKRQKELEKFIK